VPPHRTGTQTRRQFVLGCAAGAAIEAAAPPGAPQSTWWLTLLYC